jgi:hypothetical protein
LGHAAEEAEQALAGRGLAVGLVLPGLGAAWCWPQARGMESQEPTGIAISSAQGCWEAADWRRRAVQARRTQLAKRQAQSGQTQSRPGERPTSAARGRATARRP